MPPKYIDPPGVKPYGEIGVCKDEIVRVVDNMDMEVYCLLCDIHNCQYNNQEELMGVLIKIARQNGKLED
jgi:hypothetical protein